MIPLISLKKSDPPSKLQLSWKITGTLWSFLCCCAILKSYNNSETAVCGYNPALFWVFSVSCGCLAKLISRSTNSTVYICLLVIFADQVFIDPTFFGIFVCDPLQSFVVNTFTIKWSLIWFYIVCTILVLNKVERNFIRGGSAPRSNSLPFYIPFLEENVPLSFTFFWQMVPLSPAHIPYFRT